MHYNIALLPKKLLITLLGYILWKVIRYVTFALLLSYFLNMSRAWLLFLIQEVLFIAHIKALSHQKSVMNKPQAKGKINLLL